MHMYLQQLSFDTAQNEPSKVTFLHFLIPNILMRSSPYLQTWICTASLAPGTHQAFRENNFTRLSRKKFAQDHAMSRKITYTR